MQDGLDSALLSLCSRGDVKPGEVQHLLDQGADPKAKGPDGTVAEVLFKTMYREAARSSETSTRGITDSLYVLERAGADVGVMNEMNPAQVGRDELLIEEFMGEDVSPERARALCERGASPNAYKDGKPLIMLLAEKHMGVLCRAAFDETTRREQEQDARGVLEAATLLIELGADLQLKDSHGISTEERYPDLREYCSG